ncbi:chromosome transmission fidelity protein 8 homolog [Trifolium pratense]|uniref:Uncharacterized protein n=1 Tax=Trifolium pratense TaxID=57577 RepID=A0ACB0JB26_TRIPR|nr:chromosome transmission fidelity protein 8 homolog [Trifolium pratense]CAJ2641869.1 unnamed protein product [Trifolium pratense]
MQIHVKCNCNEGNCEEWGIVELQGVVESQPGFQDSLANLQIGTLCRPSNQEQVYTLTIGYHELQGSKVSLKKPLVVLKKVKLTCGEVELQVVGIVRHKILFKTRPKAIISKPQITSKEKQKSIMLGSAASNQAV